MALTTFTGGTAAVASEVNANFTALEANSVKILGSGSGSVTGDGSNSRQELFSFSTPGALVNHVIHLHMTTNGDNTDDNSEIYLSATATGTDFQISDTNLSNARTILRVVIMAASENSTQACAIVDGYGAVAPFAGGMGAYFAMNLATFNISAAETFYVNCNVLNSVATNYRWVAYMIPGTGFI